MAFNNDWFEENITSRNSDKIMEKLVDKANYFVFPCKWINPLDNTEVGFKLSNETRNHFYQFSQILRGNESIFLNWKNSTIHENIDNVANGYVKVSYQKGDFWKVFKINDTGNLTFENQSFGMFGDFTVSYDQEKINIKSLIKIGKAEIIDFYLIPNPTILETWFKNYSGDKEGEIVYDKNFDDNDIFYISQYTNHYDANDEFLYSDIEFTNIQFQMSQSGQTIEQHIYFNSPGGGYAIPKLILNDRGLPIDFDLNENFLQDIGVKSLQIELTGNAAFAGIEIWGIPVYKKNGVWDKNDIRLYAPRKLLVESFDLPVQENFFKVNASENEYVYSNGVFTAAADLISYSQYRKDIVGDKRLDYQLILETDFQKTIATNASKKTINDISLNLSRDFLKLFGTCSVASNQNFYSGDNADGTVGYGLTSFNWEKMLDKGTVSFKDLFNTTSQIIQNINKLPFETKEKLTMSLRDIWGFGNFLNKITLGFPFFWREVITDTEKNYPRLQTLPLLFPSAFYRFSGSTGYASNLQANTNNSFQNYSLASIINSKSKQGKIPGDYFQQDQSDTLGSVFGNSSVSTALTINLTDKLKLSLPSKPDIIYTTSTVYLNQIFPGEKNVAKWDYNTKSVNADIALTEIVDVDGNSYIITHIGFKSLSGGDARILTMTEKPRNFSPDKDFRQYINFQTFTNTEANYRNGQIREWFTLIICSYLDSLKKSEKPFSFPAALPLTPPSGREYLTNFSTEVNWNLDANKIVQRWTRGSRRVDQTGNKYFPVQADIDANHTWSIASNSEKIHVGGSEIPAYIVDNAFSIEFADNGFKTRQDILKVFKSLTVQCDNQNLINVVFNYGPNNKAYILTNNGINKEVMLADILKENIWVNYNVGNAGIIAGGTNVEGSTNGRQLKIYLDNWQFSIKGKFVSETRIQFDLKLEFTIQQSGYATSGNQLIFREIGFRIRNHLLPTTFLSANSKNYYDVINDDRNGSTIIISANSIIDQ